MIQDIGKLESANGASCCDYLHSGSIIIGNLFLQNDARIEGTVEGDIAAMDHLIIGNTAEITGRIDAPSVVVSGKVVGDIKATQKIEIRASARIVGNLTSPILVVEPGAVLDGHCIMSETPFEEQEARVEAEVIMLTDSVGQNQGEPSQHGVSFFITKRQRAELRVRGYYDAAIDKMRPAEAHKTLGLIPGSLVLVEHLGPSRTFKHLSGKRIRPDRHR